MQLHNSFSHSPQNLDNQTKLYYTEVCFGQKLSLAQNLFDKTSRTLYLDFRL